MHDDPDHDATSIGSEQTSSMEPPLQTSDAASVMASDRVKGLRYIAGFLILFGTFGLAVWGWCMYCDSRYTSHLNRISSGFTIDRDKNHAHDPSFDKTDTAKEFAPLDIEEGETFVLLEQVAPADKPFTGLRANLQSEAVSQNYVDAFACNFIIGGVSRPATIKKSSVEYIFELPDIVVDKPVDVELFAHAQKGFFVANTGTYVMELTLSGLRPDGCAPLTITRKVIIHKGGRGVFEGWQ